MGCDVSTKTIAIITCVLSLILQVRYLNYATFGSVELTARAEFGRSDKNRRRGGLGSSLLGSTSDALFGSPLLGSEGGGTPRLEDIKDDVGDVAHFSMLMFPNATTAQAGQTFTELLEEKGCILTSFCYSCLAHKNFWRKGGPEICAHRGCACLAEIFGKYHPKPMPIIREITITPPTVTDTTKQRRIPRIIHQTYKSELNAEDHPNWSRFQNSWKHSGWDYRFYPNNKAAMYLTRYFPPEVRAAYDAIIPGAYKADLFRLCVLLLHGGLYVDIDILPHLNPDVMIEPDVGFAIPLDYIPGQHVNNTPFLWNGFMAVSPGHPAIAKAVETMVNAINNRHQGFDFDYRMVHDLDYIYLNHDNAPLQWGPGLLGFALNRVLGRRAQHKYDVGTMDTTGSNVPGKTVILRYARDVNGLTTIADVERNLLMATTSLEGHEFLNNTGNHYSVVADHNIAFGSKGVYVDQQRMGKEIRIVVRQQEQEEVEDVEYNEAP